MTSIEKQFITTVLEKEKLSMYEVSQLIEWLAKMFKGAEGTTGLFTEVSEQVNEDINNAARAAQGIGKKLLEIYQGTQTALSAAYEDSEKKANEVYEHYSQIVKKYQNNINGMQKIQFPEVRLPYNWKEVLEMTERLSQMSKEQREVFYELIEKYKIVTS